MDPLLIKNLIGLWAKDKPPLPTRRHPSVATPLSPSHSPPILLEAWTTIDDALRVFPKCIIEHPDIAKVVAAHDGVLSMEAQTLLPLCCGGHDCFIQNRVGESSPCRARARQVALVSAFVVLHTVSQPVLEAFQGPLAFIIAPNEEECTRWYECCSRCGSERLSLVAHDTSKGVIPAIPVNRRAEIVIGTVHSISEWMQKKHYTNTRLTLCILDHPECVALRGPQHDRLLGSLLEQIPLHTQRVIMTVAAWHLWNVPGTGTPSSCSKLVKSLSPCAAVLSVPDGGADKGDIHPCSKRSRAESSVAMGDHDSCMTLIWNVRVDDAADDDETLDTCVADLYDDLRGLAAVASSTEASEALLTASKPWSSIPSCVSALATWCDVHDAVRSGVVGVWPPMNGAVVNFALSPRTLAGRRFNGRFLCCVSGSRVASRQLAGVADALPRALLLRNITSADELRDPQTRTAILEDLRNECEPLGEITEISTWTDPCGSGPCLAADYTVYHDTARILITFAAPVAALEALEKLHGRQFDGRVVHCTLIEAGQSISTRTVDAVDPLELIPP